ncbi:hypothetical protein RB595_006886 [Gaeumannomyces hyphopodioides]
MRSSIFRIVAAATLALVLPVSGALSLEDGAGVHSDVGRGCGFKIAPCEAGSTCSALDPACPATRHENCQGVCRPIKTAPPRGTTTLGPIDRHTRTTRTTKKPTPVTTTRKPTPTVTSTRKPTSHTTKKPPTTTTKKPTSRTRTTRHPPRPTATPPRYEDCGGKRVVPKDCPAGHVCVDDPRRGGCGMACDAPGICVRPTTPCSGLAGVVCPAGKMCVDDPRDDCWATNGGRDCSGICV